MSLPPSRTSPASAAVGINSCIRFKVRKNVDLPHPDGPISAVTVPDAKSKVTSFNACFDPNHAFTLRASRPVPIGMLPGAFSSREDATEARDLG